MKIDIRCRSTLSRVSFLEGVTPRVSERVGERAKTRGMRATPLCGDLTADWLRAVSCHQSMIGGSRAALG